MAGVDGLLTLLTDRVDDELLDAAGPRLRVVSNFAVGYDNIDVAACTRRGIPVGNTPGVLTETTADLAWALLMAAARRVVEGDRYVRDGRWRTWGPMLLLGNDVHGATLGIVGFGRIGQAVARRAAGFGMRVLYHARSRVAADVEARPARRGCRSPELLAAVRLRHAPREPERRDPPPDRRGGAAAMKPAAVLVNTSRGPVVDTGALVDALRSGLFRAAALDVTDPEPLPADHPLVALDNCLVVPHIASATVATRGRMAAMAAANLLAGVRGRAPPDARQPRGLRP